MMDQITRRERNANTVRDFRAESAEKLRENAEDFAARRGRPLDAALCMKRVFQRESDQKFIMVYALYVPSQERHWMRVMTADTIDAEHAPEISELPEEDTDEAIVDVMSA